ncbi:MAG: hypothetical protein ACT4P7_04575 [Gemmatimonadaceae bacterium]
MLPSFALLVAAQDPEATRVILERTWLDQVAIIGQSLVSLLVLILLVAATVALLALRRALDELTRLVRSTSADVTGAIHDARMVVEELRTLTGRVRGTADLVRTGVRRAKGALDSARRAPELDRSDEADEQGMAGVNREERMRRRRRRRRGGERPRPEGGEQRERPGDTTE